MQWKEENIEASEKDSKNLVFKNMDELEPRTQVLIEKVVVFVYNKGFS